MCKLLNQHKHFALNNSSNLTSINNNKFRYCSEFKVLGFDCEYEIINNTRTVVLLQLQTYQGLCLLIRLNKLATIPVELKVSVNCYRNLPKLDFFT